MNEELQDADFDFPKLRQLFQHIARDQVKAARARFKRKFLLNPFHAVSLKQAGISHKFCFFVSVSASMVRRGIAGIVWANLLAESLFLRGPCHLNACPFVPRGVRFPARENRSPAIKIAPQYFTK